MTEENLIEVLTDIVTHCEKRMCDGEFQTLNEELHMMSENILFMDTREVITWLRTSFAAKEFLPDWKCVVDQAHKTFLLKGMDADHLLRGLR